MIKQSLGKQFLAAVITKGSIKDLAFSGDLSTLFKNTEKDVYDFVSYHTKKHGVLPALETIKNETGESLYDVPEPPSYYLEALRERHIELSLKKGAQDAQEFLGAVNKAPQKALEAMLAALMPLMISQAGARLADYRNVHDIVMPQYVSQWKQGDDFGVQMGWPTLDNAIGGLIGGDVLSIVGRPASGKSMLLLYSALHTWKTQFKRPLFVSMEMNILSIFQRLAATDTSVPISNLKMTYGNALTTAQYKKINDLQKHTSLEAPFWVLDANLKSTVEEIFTFCRMFRPDVVFIDGAYLLKHPKITDRYLRVAENADQIKQFIAGELGIPCVASWQFSREAAKKQSKKQNPGLEDIAYADAIGQVSSIVLGLWEQESVETLLSRIVTVMKGRGGEVGQFPIAWDWIGMDFSELVPKAVSELTFL